MLTFVSGSLMTPVALQSPLSSLGGQTGLAWTPLVSQGHQEEEQSQYIQPGILSLPGDDLDDERIPRIHISSH